MYFQFLADENAAQRNTALDELADAKASLRLSGVTISDLESSLASAHDDIAKLSNELDAVYNWAQGAGQYMEDLEKNADAVLVASQERLRQRISVIEAENLRLSQLADQLGSGSVGTSFDSFIADDPALAPLDNGEVDQIAETAEE